MPNKSRCPNTIRCPRCNEELLTDGGYLQRVPKPDPQASFTSVQDKGGIVKAARRQTEKKKACTEDIAFLLTEFPCLLEAENKALRNLFRNHEGRLDSQKKVMEANFDAIADQFTDNKRTIDCLVNWQCRHPELHKPLERKVEELEKSYRSHLLEGHKNLIIRSSNYNAIIDRKPQPKGGVARPDEGRARCKDEGGIEHDLIPRVSFYKTAGYQLVRFNDKSGDYLHGEALLGDNNRVMIPAKSHAHIHTITFLFNLDPPGGDK